MLYDFSISGSVPLRTDRHRLAGSVSVDGSPAKRLVVVVLRGTLAYVGATFSDSATGAWEISGTQEYDERSLLVLALDNTGNYNAEVADYISQVTGN